VVAGHRLKLGERGVQGGLRTHDAGAIAGATVAKADPAKRTPAAVAGLNRLPKQQLPVA
jgi:hypothetical protein